jgi:hypothetical protein
MDSSSLLLTVGLRKFRIVPGGDLSRIDCDMDKGEIRCSPLATLDDLQPIINEIRRLECPSTRAIPCLRRSDEFR